MAGMLWACACVAQANTTTVDIAAFVKPDSFDDIKISPTGEYYAATVPGEDSSILVIINSADNKPVAGFGLGSNTYIADFEWVNPKRVVFATARKFGALDQPQLTGNLYAMNSDGTGKDILVGQDVNTMSTGSHIQTKKAETIAAFLLDGLPDDDKNVLITVWPFEADGFSRVEKMDIYTGRRTPVARAPVPNANYVTDPQGHVRFAFGRDLRNDNRLYYRAADASDWTRTTDWREINDEESTGHAETPLGFSADGRIAYLQVEQDKGPDMIVAFDPADGSRRTILQDDDSDPAEIIRSLGTHYPAPVGAFIDDGKPRTAFFDDSLPEARLYRSLEAAFAGNRVEITSTTADGRLALVQVSSDRDPGEFYLFDTVAKKASYLLARREWQDPETMAEVRPIALKARDGLALHGFLTLPHGSDGKHLPLVVLPHGGPFWVADGWGFDSQTQLLAAAGYAVLQVNFRGSSGYGRAFSQAGAREWGGRMQDDVTDATRWAIDQGVADPSRICIFGASYGGYAALMGVAREPGMYKCAAGYVGVYDLPLMFRKGDIQDHDSGEAFLHEWLGEPATLGQVSPVNLATRIKAPVFLAAGGQDERAPIAHSEKMEQALRAAGVPVETLYVRTEGHGFYTQEHQRAFYTKLLAFLDSHIGGTHDAATATGAATHSAH
jgi:dipeptidyl aminopeptidase/acylaminoacyl peptidase